MTVSSVSHSSPLFSQLLVCAAGLQVSPSMLLSLYLHVPGQKLILQVFMLLLHYCGGVEPSSAHGMYAGYATQNHLSEGRLCSAAPEHETQSLLNTCSLCFSDYVTHLGEPFHKSITTCVCQSFGNANHTLFVRPCRVHTPQFSSIFFVSNF